MMRRTDDRSQQTTSDRQMYDAICSKCGNRCQIPFQPRPGKQVFCSHCFEQKEKGESFTPEKPRSNDDFATLNIKLDKILRLLEALRTTPAVPSEVKKEEIKAEPVNEIIKASVKKAPAKKKSAP